MIDELALRWLQMFSVPDDGEGGGLVWIRQDQIVAVREHTHFGSTLLVGHTWVRVRESTGDIFKAMEVNRRTLPNRTTAQERNKP